MSNSALMLTFQGVGIPVGIPTGFCLGMEWELKSKSSGNHEISHENAHTETTPTQEDTQRHFCSHHSYTKSAQCERHWNPIWILQYEPKKPPWYIQRGVNARYTQSRYKRYYFFLIWRVSPHTGHTMFNPLARNPNLVLNWTHKTVSKQNRNCFETILKPFCFSFIPLFEQFYCLSARPPDDQQTVWLVFTTLQFFDEFFRTAQPASISVLPNAQCNTRSWKSRFIRRHKIDTFSRPNSPTLHKSI